MVLREAKYGVSIFFCVSKGFEVQSLFLIHDKKNIDDPI